MQRRRSTLSAGRGLLFLVCFCFFSSTPVSAFTLTPHQRRLSLSTRTGSSSSRLYAQNDYTKLEEAAGQPSRGRRELFNSLLGALVFSVSVSSPLAASVSRALAEETAEEAPKPKKKSIAEIRAEAELASRPTGGKDTRPKRVARNDRPVDLTKYTQVPGGDGIAYLDEQRGSGDPPQLKDRVAIHYELECEGRQVYSTRQSDYGLGGLPFAFNWGIYKGPGSFFEYVQKGMDGMKLGGTRRIFVPGSIAFGGKGAGPDAPPGADVEFYVTLLSLKRKGTDENLSLPGMQAAVNPR
uniref:peptidylprolyl isomerase n=1 Tax=Chromera velia CCMP2878 TaxID=1169474 RepID=A0A0G4GUN6_9ALVE|mmetsp:Transcript_9053/g.17727  ORF Transcript_9053/g.17727 Transcript_9053/m.17727 type:complete len:296 (-) Transcript_9053:554-1441(-)|eukprot:Cvel_23377.t1-p1 / transcript=Cvel_23377.t1 / gene=Cvel_23377 / organism=Chromera_velia_CCMP2878 / gene_product=hypothetical protein / transcript_product=hypothetical protein / location=Cvel_scaffold2402:1803-6005(+) / protein_length=295 / sequence_SO=supercontig / SO=protein_coding / is_pseudo=false